MTYWSDNYAPAFDNEGEAGVDGSTEEKAYEIRTAEQLALLAYRINTSSTNSTYKSLYYIQTADINLSAHLWNSIGIESYHFSGYYDGSKHEILGMDTDPTNSNNGLFGVIQDAEIFNINIGSSETLISNSGSIGAVVGSAYNSKIYNCSNSETIYKVDADYTGGIVGYAMTCEIYSCSNSGSINGDSNVGGIVGELDHLSEIRNCYNTGTITGSGENIGGLVGKTFSIRSEGYITFTNNYNLGTIVGGSNVGGLAGYVSFLHGYNCYDIKSSGSDYSSFFGVVDSSAWGGLTTIKNFYDETIEPNVAALAKDINWYSYDETDAVWDPLYMWDFENVWTIVQGENDGFPILKNSINANIITLNPNGGTGGMETIYLSENVFYADANLNEPITKLSTLPTLLGYTFEGFYTSPDGGVMVINSEGVIVADVSSISSITTLYAQWSTAVSAYYDSEGGFWYVENGRLPQERVTDEMTIASLNSSITIGEMYYIAGMYLGSKVLNGEEYCLYNDVWYKVEPIKWRLQYSSSQQVGYSTTTETLAIMAEIVYIDAFSDNVLGVGEGYTAESINSFMLYNKIDDSYLKTESRTVDLFGSTTLTTTTSVTSNMFVASYDELSNFTTNANNTAEKVGEIKISDFVKDYLRANGKDAFYYIRDLGSNYNNIKCLGADGGLTQYKAQNKLGIQFSVKYTQYACL